MQDAVAQIPRTSDSSGSWAAWEAPVFEGLQAWTRGRLLVAMIVLDLRSLRNLHLEDSDYKLQV